MFFNPGQFSKIFSLNESILIVSGILIVVKAIQSLKAPFPIIVTFSGIFIVFKASHSKKAYSPISVNLLFPVNVTVVKASHPPKA